MVLYNPTQHLQLPHVARLNGNTFQWKEGLAIHSSLPESLGPFAQFPAPTLQDDTNNHDDQDRRYCSDQCVLDRPRFPELASHQRCTNHPD